MNLSNANILKMNDYETTKFIELYKKEPILWNPTVTDYKCRAKRTAAAKRIAASMGLKYFTHMHVIQKFKNLRSSYLQELKKIAHSAESIGSNEELYVPKVVWFKLMDSFLKPHVKQRIPTANLKIEPDACSSYTLETETMEQAQEIWSGNVKPQDIKSRTTPSDDYVISSSNETEKPTQFPLNCVSNSREDSFDYFGRYLASALRDMPKRRALQLEGEIMTLLIKSQMEIHSRSPSSSSMLSENTN